MTLEELKTEVRAIHAGTTDEVPDRVYHALLELINQPDLEAGYRLGVIDSLLTLVGMIVDCDIVIRRAEG